MKKFLLLGTACVLSSTVKAQEISYTPLGVYELAYPYPSPKGDKVVVQADFDGRWQLYEISLEDGAIRRLHVSARDDTHPAFSPDGKKLAFISNRAGNDDVYVLDISSGEAAPLAPHPGKDGHPKWSADGEWIVFNRTFDPEDLEGDTDSAIIQVRKNGEDLTIVSDTENIETLPSYSRDAGAVAFVEWMPVESGRPIGDIVVVDARTGERRNLTQSPEDFDAYPYWGRSGEWIYFTTFKENGEGGREGVVRRVRPDGGDIEDLTTIDGVSEVRAIPNKEETILYLNRINDGRVQVFSIPIAGES